MNFPRRNFSARHEFTARYTQRNQLKAIFALYRRLFDIIIIIMLIIITVCQSVEVYFNHSEELSLYPEQQTVSKMGITACYKKKIISSRRKDHFCHDYSDMFNSFYIVLLAKYNIEIFVIDFLIFEFCVFCFFAFYFTS